MAYESHGEEKAAVFLLCAFCLTALGQIATDTLTGKGWAAAKNSGKQQVAGAA